MPNIIRRNRSAVRCCGGERPNTTRQHRRRVSLESDRTRWISAAMAAGSAKRCSMSARPRLRRRYRRTALRTSHAIAVVMLFLCGYSFGSCAGLRPWATGLVMIVIGGVLVGVAIAFGG
jgi:hypothetical protein